MAAKLLLVAMFVALALVAVQLRTQKRALAQITLSTAHLNDSIERARSAARRYDVSFAAVVSALADKSSLSSVEEGGESPTSRAPQREDDVNQSPRAKQPEIAHEDEVVSIRPPTEAGRDAGSP